MLRKTGIGSLFRSENGELGLMLSHSLDLAFEEKSVN